LTIIHYLNAKSLGRAGQLKHVQRNYTNKVAEENGDVADNISFLEF
jgi:hypothetical protein